MKKFIQEFKAFALRGNVMDMAVGVMIGSAFSGIVTSLTDNFITPVISLLTGAARYSLQDAAAFGASFASSVVNFLIQALILFCMMKAVNKLPRPGRKPPAPHAPGCYLLGVSRRPVLHSPFAAFLNRSNLLDFGTGGSWGITSLHRLVMLSPRARAVVSHWAKYLS